ncbi:universal stress protein [Roseisolibacter agri]|uniref:UspA domain-containing protein n=1 Tax=Roseisolibacter agri TaxID=2014610 RepID=A0AA37Q1H9_9BACT|nr:universal stress protein [Roseisolibacter agri]GLC24875.1 hypothetical protein rosag_13880 [Roseisolibacter agri]
MSAAVIPTPLATLPTPVAPERAAGALLVAADGREDVRPAMQVAAAVSARLRVPVRVLAALEPSTPDGADGALPVADRHERDRLATVRAVMRRRVRESVGGEAAWPVEAVQGAPTATIARAAQDAALVLVGAGWSDRSVRPLGTERALAVAGSGAAPVLAVGADADGAFTRAVVALDFGPASVHAAELACRLLAPGGTLSLVHVKERLEFVGPAGESWDALCTAQIAELFRRLVAALQQGGAAPIARDGRVVEGGGAVCAGRRDVTIGTATLVGDAAEELLTYAALVGADLVAAGTRGDDCVPRRRLGSVSGEVARRATATMPRASVLVCPVPRTAGAAAARDALDETEWRLALDGFWRRNAGRPATVEVDEAPSGTRLLARGATLVRAGYDPRARRAELVLDDADDRTCRLTRAMGDVRAVAVLTGVDGRDVALRVKHGRGQTLVTFLPDDAAA